MNPNSPPLPSLRRDLKYTIHYQGSSIWYCIEDPLNGRFFRLGNREYAMASRFKSELTAQSLADELNQSADKLEEISLKPVTQHEVSTLTVWLSRSGLMESQSISQTSRPYQQWTFNPLSMRFPLISGYRVERLCAPLVPFLTIHACWIVLALYALAMIAAVRNWSQLAMIGQDLFVADSQLWWLTAWLILKMAHELGHAVVAMRVGSPIRAAGINVMFFAPIPFVDLSDLWSIPSRWQRIACSAGGMLAEMAVAAIAVFLAVYSQSESLQYLCCAIAVTGTVSTLAFNANPLMRFDGYHIVADLLNISNLWTRSQAACIQWMQQLMMPWRAQEHGLAPLAFAIYGGLCMIYRTLISFTMAATAILVWESFGVLLVVWAGFVLYLRPLYAQVQRRMTTPQLGGSTGPSRLEIFGGTAIAICALAGLAVLPSPIQPVTPGVVTFHDPIQISAQARGILDQVLVQVGDQVAAGQVLARLLDPDLELELSTKRLELTSIQDSMRTSQARGNLAELQASKARLESLETQLDQLESRQRNLQITAPQAGKVVQLSISNSLGQRIDPGLPICMLATSTELEAKLAASQQDLNAFNQSEGQSVWVRVIGGSQLQAIVHKVEPKAISYLTDPLLAGCFGGPVPVQIETDRSSGQDQWRLTSPRFEVHLRLPDDTDYVPGQLIWAYNPGKSTSIIAALGGWIRSKWNELSHQIEG